MLNIINPGLQGKLHYLTSWVKFHVHTDELNLFHITSYKLLLNFLLLTQHKPAGSLESDKSSHRNVSIFPASIIPLAHCRVVSEALQYFWMYYYRTDKMFTARNTDFSNPGAQLPRAGPDLHPS